MSSGRQNPPPQYGAQAQGVRPLGTPSQGGQGSQYGANSGGAPGQPKERNALGNFAGTSAWLNPFTFIPTLLDQTFNEGRGREAVQDWANQVGESMGMSGPPQIQDYASIAEREAAANRPDQSTPFGSTRWTRDANGNWVQSTELSGDLGQSATDLMRRINEAGPLDFSGLPELDYGDTARQQAQEAAYGESARHLDPAFAQRESSLRTQLLNQGLDPNSQAGRAAMAQLAGEREGAYTGARNQAFDQGQRAQQQAFGQSMQARGQKMSELIRGRQSYFEDMGNLQQLLQMPGFKAGPELLQAAGMQDQAALQRWLQQQQANADAFGGLGDVAIKLLPLLAGSDARIKRGIRRLGAHLLPGVRFATWEYRSLPGRWWLGVIAQDLARVAPCLVFPGADGILRVPFLPIEVTRA